MKLARTFATAALLALSTTAFSAEPTPEAAINARLDASLHRVLHRLARAAKAAQAAPSATLAVRDEVATAHYRLGGGVSRR